MHVFRAISSAISLLSFVVLSVAVNPNLFAASANAQSANPVLKGISISPPLKEIILGPGLIEAHTTVTLTNNSGQTVVTRLRLVDLQSLDEFGGVSLGEVGAISTRYNLAKWMALTEDPVFTLQNGQVKSVPITILNSSEMAPGGHYGALIAEIQDTSKSKGSANQISLKQELVSLLFIKKVGGETYGLKMESMSANGGLSTPDSINIVFKNTGNVHVVPRGYIELTDAKGGVVAKGIINPESTLVLPEKKRQFITVLQPIAAAKNGTEYKVTAYFRYDGVDDYSTFSIKYGKKAQTIFIFGLVIFVSFLLAAGAYWRRRNKNRKPKFIRK